jgi:lipopolysaccharide export system permease protein
VSFFVGLVGLHILVSLLVAFIFWLRVRNRPLFKLPSFTRSKGT